MSPRTIGFKRAFTLVEMLAVIGIIVVLMTLIAPAVNSVLMSQGVNGATYDIAGFLESARSEAVARQTYVWVGLTMETRSGSTDLVAGAVYSRDGSGTSAIDPTLPPDPSDLAPLGKTLRIHNVALTSWGNLKAATRNLLPGQTPVSVALSTSGLSFKIGGTSFNKTTLTFTPRGEAMLQGKSAPDDGFDPCIDVSFQQAQGGVAKAGANDAAAIVQGSTGTVRILRL